MRIFGTLLAALFVSGSAFASIDGLYTTGCLKVQQSSALSFEIYEKGQFESGSVEFADANCQIPFFSRGLAGTFTESSVNGQNAIDRTFKSQTFTFFDKGVADSIAKAIADGQDTDGSLKQLLDQFQGFIDDLNDQEFCDMNDWEIGVAKDVTGKECTYLVVRDGKVQGIPFPTLEKEVTDYAIYSVQADATDSTINLLYWGEYTEQLDGSSTDKRPTVIMQDPIFVKVPEQTTAE